MMGKSPITCHLWSNYSQTNNDVAQPSLGNGFSMRGFVFTLAEEHCRLWQIKDLNMAHLAADTKPQDMGQTTISYQDAGPDASQEV